MNKLSYGLLSLIAVEPCTGYDLTQRIQLFWNANHSQIYPLLAQLEEGGYVRFTLVPQTDKPDKKVYTITPEGMEAVRQWITGPTDYPVVRDEFALKIFSLFLVDKPSIKGLLEEKIRMLDEKLARLNKRLVQLAERRKPGEESYDLTSPMFGAQILIEKSIATKYAERDWCLSIIRKLEEPGPVQP
ncbi:PadR family transcriptional regulator [Paenibacillus sp. YN15]|uniref:PadR family transcriptional regulator n=1 Tax=Paenibacillus sp. YN15 TaxID=1742774 RepID=UPI0015EBCDF1|nr:PadR family transcriptional regulator [Paenibacillus sp. YN15]